MQDAFRDIERGHEAKYKLDEELRFKAQCRRTRLLGHWAAQRMGMARAEADAYAKRLVALNLERPGTAHIVAKVLGDLDEAGVAVNEMEVIAAIDQFYAEALASLAEDFPAALDRDHIQIGG
ncbi:MAG: DUF1476 domain-containing protein [Hyphomicrobium sp.]